MSIWALQMLGGSPPVIVTIRHNPKGPRTQIVGLQVSVWALQKVRAGSKNEFPWVQL